MTMTKSSIKTDHKIMITQIFDAPHLLLFKAWTKSEHPMPWRGPEAEKPGEMIR
jgi:uncharacterized protein YndB with AHSA1/START domain